MERSTYSLGVYPEECNQAKTLFHEVVQWLQSRLDQSPLGEDGMIRKVEWPDFWSLAALLMARPTASEKAFVSLFVLLFSWTLRSAAHCNDQPATGC